MTISDFDTPSTYLICRWLLAMMTEKERKCKDRLSKGTKDDPSFCATGLAGEVLVNMGLYLWNFNDDPNYMNPLQEYADELSVYETGLPPEARDVYGMEVMIPMDIAHRHWPKGDTFPIQSRSQVSVSSFAMILNDKTDLSFPEIAMTLHGLFVELEAFDVPAWLMRYVLVAEENNIERALAEAEIHAPWHNDTHPDEGGAPMPNQRAPSSSNAAFPMA